MPPLYSYLCNACAHEFEELCSTEDRLERKECPHCETLTGTWIPSAAGGYRMTGDNGASQTPKGSGSWKRK